MGSILYKSNRLRNSVLHVYSLMQNQDIYIYISLYIIIYIMKAEGEIVVGW